MAGKEFDEKQASEKQVEDLLRYSRSEHELRETVAFLIRNRERLRDVELKRLEVESAELMKRLKNANRQRVMEEIASFKDVLELHRRLIEAKEKLR